MAASLWVKEKASSPDRVLMVERSVHLGYRAYFQRHRKVVNQQQHRNR
jgi:hypothetical protein